jgi:hypothetical protein
MAIWQDLVEDGFTAARYASVRCFVHHLRGSMPPEARVVITTSVADGTQESERAPFAVHLVLASPPRRWAADSGAGPSAARRFPGVGDIQERSMNRDDVHTRQWRVQRKMLNLKRLCHPDCGKIWTMVDYWTIQPRRFGEGRGRSDG